MVQYSGGHLLYDSLLSIEKPARYMGGEIGSVAKESVDVRFVLAFPDVYEVMIAMIDLADAFCALYPALNRDLLISGILLH
ncbi:MAG: hypothetical protein PHD01_15350, partial [Geobacteraceae bacterium]|nr:hypothetical protein [Geobacteraceae bacterium]